MAGTKEDYSARLAAVEQSITHFDTTVTHQEDLILSLMEKASHIARQLEKFDRDYVNIWTMKNNLVV